jgi:hypothetical protein
MARLIARASLASGKRGSEEAALILREEYDRIDPEHFQHHFHVAEPAIYSIDG